MMRAAIRAAASSGTLGTTVDMDSGPTPASDEAGRGRLQSPVRRRELLPEAGYLPTVQHFGSIAAEKPTRAAS